MNERQPGVSDVPPPSDEIDTAPWELLENGRYMPRRIRGSFPGRELG